MNLLLALTPLLAFSTAPQPVADASELGASTYRVQQTTVLNQIPEGTEQVDWWISIPGDARAQQLLDFEVVSAPGPWRIVTEPDRGNRFLLVEVAAPKTEQLETVVAFTLRREEICVDIDPQQVGQLTPRHRKFFAEATRMDAPNMAVTPAILDIAKEVCGNETNPALQTRALLGYVAAQADHYSKDPSKPSCGIGNAENCLKNAGGCCTDLHSLFISLARARGIPARLQMGYRLLHKNAGVEQVDPGYRCWAEYFLPGYGWIPADIVEADSGDEPGLWFNGLTTERLWLNSGREFKLGTNGPVNHMSMGHAELDGVPARLLPEGDLAPQLSRHIGFEIMDSKACTPLNLH